LGERAPRLFFCLNIAGSGEYVHRACLSTIIACYDLVMSSSFRVLAGAALMLCCAAGLLTSGCAPSLSPLYRDYAVTDTVQATETRITRALQQAGWSVGDESPPEAIATDERTLSNWGLYRVVASLEVVPLGSGHVRVLIHPYRAYFTGSRSKMPFLRRSLQRAILPELNAALEAEGLQVAGTALEREQPTSAR
jgi:hypothetical protein